MTVGAIGSAVAGAAVTGLMSDGGDDGGGGGGGGSFEMGFMDGYDDEYKYKSERWNDLLQKALSRAQTTGTAQRDRNAELLQYLLGASGDLYAQTNYEKNWADQVAKTSSQLDDMWNQNTPAYQDRLARAEAEINRNYADSLNEYVDANAHKVALGGMGTLNPERMDQMLASAIAAKKDTANREAHQQVMDDLAKVVSGGQAQVGLDKDLAVGDRARKTAGFNYTSTNLLQQEANNQAYENLINDIMDKYDALQPDYYDTKNKYRYQSSGYSGMENSNSLQSQLAQMLGGAASKLGGQIGGTLGNLASGYMSGGNYQPGSSNLGSGITAFDYPNSGTGTGTGGYYGGGDQTWGGTPGGDQWYG